MEISREGEKPTARVPAERAGLERPERLALEADLLPHEGLKSRGIDLTRSIPELRPPLNWKQIPIQECGEPLVALSSLANARIVFLSEYAKKGIPGAIEEMYLRKGAAERLAKAAASLPPGYSLAVWDAWRPLEVQQALFDRQCADLKVDHPATPNDQLQKMAETYVSRPSSDPTKPSPHYTGGAIDLTIIGPDGQLLPMGTEFDAFDVMAGTRFLEDKAARGQLSSVEEQALLNRRMLFHAMTTAGFTNYNEEWWHFDYGNQFWAAVTGVNAMYSGIESH